MAWIQSQIESSVLSCSSSTPLLYSDYQKQAIPLLSSSGSKLNPNLILIIVVLSVFLSISGFLHFLVKCLTKHKSASSIAESNRYTEMSGSDAIRRQLQQLFNLHDSGLDQTSIDALPVFHYKDIMGSKEPFDCAVCLCEFNELDNLRLLPDCTHAFHIACIDRWLLSNSTCPLCRGTVFTPPIPIDNQVRGFGDSSRENELSGNNNNHNNSSSNTNRVSGLVSICRKDAENEIFSDGRVFSVRLGKYRRADNENGDVESSSSSNLDGRRCYSMGSYQYVVTDSDLVVASCYDANKRLVKPSSGAWKVEEDLEGKKINMRSKGESFSVSKIWQWSRKKEKFTTLLEAHAGSSSGGVSGVETGRTRCNGQ